MVLCVLIPSELVTKVVCTPLPYYCFDCFVLCCVIVWKRTHDDFVSIHYAFYCYPAHPVVSGSYNLESYFVHISISLLDVNNIHSKYIYCKGMSAYILAEKEKAPLRRLCCFLQPISSFSPCRLLLGQYVRFDSIPQPTHDSDRFLQSALESRIAVLQLRRTR